LVSPCRLGGLELYQPASTGGTGAVAGVKVGSRNVEFVPPGEPPIVTKESIAGFAPPAEMLALGSQVPARLWIVFESLWRKVLAFAFEIVAS